MCRGKSGHLNIWITPAGNYRVLVFTDYLGTFKDLIKAVKVRNDYRKEQNLPPAED